MNLELDIYFLLSIYLFIEYTYREYIYGVGERQRKREKQMERIYTIETGSFLGS
jgi:hypothetical protein